MFGNLLYLIFIDVILQLMRQYLDSQEASKVYGMSKDTAFHKACTDEFQELLFEQEVRILYG